MSSIYNFYAGPAVIYEEVLREAREEFMDFAGTGMSVLTVSHRSKAFDAVMVEAEANMKELMGLGDDYRVLFLQGGASTQFSMIPMNFLPEGRTADYILTGSWSEKALKEAKKIGNTHVAYDGSTTNYTHIPRAAEMTFSEDPVYVHMTSNNTIYGTEFDEIPQTDAPLIADMSSDILSKPMDFNRFAMIYAGAQKNLGPAGVTVVVIRKDLLETAQDVNATMLKYSTHADKNSLYNTPPAFSVYMVNLVLRHLKKLGLTHVAANNVKKAKVIYDAIDASAGFYKGHADKESRSLMNITFTMDSPELEKKFVAEGEDSGFIGIKGHRSVGGLRASVYNAMPLEGAEAFADFMAEFMRKNG
ncbi:MAG: 3-phosphoserine/phosphohydroxythreonine transaminase [Clostridia bacterium]